MQLTHEGTRNGQMVYTIGFRLGGATVHHNVVVGTDITGCEHIVDPCGFRRVLRPGEGHRSREWAFFLAHLKLYRKMKEREKDG